MFRRLSGLGMLAASLLCAACSPATAQTVTTTGGQIRGTVTGTHGGISGAAITVSGPIVRSAVSRANGTFTLTDLAAGLYTISVKAAGYDPTARAGITVFESETVVDVTLSPTTASAGGLTQIGAVKAIPSNGHFNVTSAAFQQISEQTLVERDLTNVRDALESVPGVTLSRSSEYEGNNSAVFDNVVFATVRGGEPFETGTLIDGHAMYGAASNLGFSVGWIPTSFLQSIDVVKGPGATTPSINNAINGSVNFVTLDPRGQKPGGDVSIESDGLGGTIARFKYINHFDRLSYAFAYQQQESPGPTDGNHVPYILGQNNTNTIDGKTFAPCVGANCYSASGPNSNTYINAADSFLPTTALYVQGLACCTTDHTAYSNRAQLAKLRYDFAPGFYVTAGYFGNQTFQELGVQNLGQFIFTPPPGYTGSLKAGPVAAATGYAGGSLAELAGPGYNAAFTLDAVGQLGKLTLSAKAIQVNSRQNYNNGLPFLGENSVTTDSVPAVLYGAVATGSTNPVYATDTDPIHAEPWRVHVYLRYEFGRLDAPRRSPRRRQPVYVRL